MSSLWCFDLSRVGKLERANDPNEHFEELEWDELEIEGIKPKPVSNHTSVMHGDKMYLFGGITGAFDSNEQFFTLDLNSYKWELLDPKPKDD